MLPFTYRVAESVEAAVELGRAEGAAFLAAGTEMVAWLKDGIASPSILVDISRLPLDRITAGPDEIRLGSLARLSDIAEHAEIRRSLPGLVEAIESAASPQLRSMGTIGGNLLQRTRCPYFRSETAVPCNKRMVGSGCSARSGDHRAGAILGASEACVATHPSDPAVMLVALGATVTLQGPAGQRLVPLADFYRRPSPDPRIETVLAPAELVTEVQVPRPAGPSRYLKLRDRAAYAFALVSAAVVLGREGRRIRALGLALGGVAHKPWRLDRVEAGLIGTSPDQAAVRAVLAQALGEAAPLPGNRFKVGLAIEAATRAVVELLEAP